MAEVEEAEELIPDAEKGVKFLAEEVEKEGPEISKGAVAAKSKIKRLLHRESEKPKGPGKMGTLLTGVAFGAQLNSQPRLPPPPPASAPPEASRPRDGQR